MTEDIQLDKIRTDGGTQARSGLDETTVQEYADAMMEHKGWGDFPPVIVFYDGSDYWLADGFHRLAAFQRNWGSLHRGKNILEVEVRQGTQRDAVLHAAGANSSHGRRRTGADKWRAVERLLVDPEWGTWSDREIARRCHVSPTFVGRVRGMLGRIDRPYHAPPPLPVHVDSNDSQRTYMRQGKTAVMDTANIGYAQQRNRETAKIKKESNNRRPEPPDGYIRFEFKRGKCPRCGNNGFVWEPSEWQAVEEADALRQEIDKLYNEWLENGRQGDSPKASSEQAQAMITHWSRFDTGRCLFGNGEKGSCGAKLWHDFGGENRGEWHYYFQLVEEAETAVSPNTCPDCNGTAIKRYQDGSLYCYSCTSLVSVPPDETATPDDYNYTTELEKSIEAAETAVSDPWVCGACAQEFGNEVDLLAHQFNSSCEEELKEGRGAGRASIVDSLKSTEWLIEEMMIQTKAPSPLFFALNTAVMAVREAMAVAIKLEETAVTQEAPQDCAMGTGAPSAGEPFVIRPLDWMIESENEEDEEAS